MTMLSRDQLRARVSEGVKWLDETKPGWRARINSEKLDMRSCLSCVLGQLFRNYNSVVDNHLAPPSLALTSQLAENFGFKVEGYFTDPLGEKQYTELGKIWKEELRGHALD